MRCIGTAADDFAGNYWGQRPLLSTSDSLPRDFLDLFSADAADELVSLRGLRSPFLRMAKDGAVLATSRFTGPSGAGSQVSDQAIDDKVLAEFAGGSTLVLQALHRTWGPLRRFADQLVDDLANPIQVNAYITPASSQGFSAHYDTHDVFVLQIEGEKLWRLHEPVIEHPLPSQPWDRNKPAVSRRASEPPYLETMLRPGDALYLPRGWLHSAAAQGATSIHLTVGIHTMTRYAIAEALLSRAADTAGLRANLPIGMDVSSAEEVGSEFDGVVKHLVARLLAAHADEVTTTLAGKLDRGIRPEPLSPLRQAKIAASVMPDLEVRIRWGLRIDVSTNTTELRGNAKLVAGQRTLTFPGYCEPALRQLADGQPVRVHDLRGLDEADAIALVSRLLREAIAVPAEQLKP